MTKTVTGEYKSKAQITNIQEELIAAGIPRKQIFVDKKTSQIKVMIADVTEPEITRRLLGGSFFASTSGSAGCRNYFCPCR